MPATVDKILGKTLLHTHQATDIIGLTVSQGGTLDATSVITVVNNTTAGTDSTILVNAASGAVTITLPAAATKTNYFYRIKKIDSSTNTVTVTPNGSDKIDGNATMVIAYQYSCMDLVSNGSNWYII